MDGGKGRNKMVGVASPAFAGERLLIKGSIREGWWKHLHSQKMQGSVGMKLLLCLLSEMEVEKSRKAC